MQGIPVQERASACPQPLSLPRPGPDKAYHHNCAEYRPIPGGGPADNPASQQGKVGQRAEHAPTRVWWGVLLSRRNALALVVVYLAITSVNDLAPVASRVIRWASTWNRPVLSIVVMVCLAWTWCGQAQWLWESIHALMHRHALRPHPATYGDIGRDQGMPEATRGLL